MTGLNHVGIAVRNLDDAVAIFKEKFGLPVTDIIDWPSNGIKVGIINTGNSILELMEPLDKNGTVAKFLEKQGRNAVHHLAFAVDKDLSVVGEEMKNLGIDMVYPSPKMGVLGHPVNFCHPKFTGDILIELSEVGYESRARKEITS
ncbi:MAG: methylmalonyl-CoA epimerase [Thaumarchaeota archaeon]|nr:methylmalonyl-CoA epimerase [Nitrososphaerota archaeon]